jgi:uncharacterized membrane protein (UPF0182 family)
VINRDVPPPRRSSAGRRVLIILAIVALFALLSLRFFATLWTDYLWFDSVDLTSVFTTLVFSRVFLVVVASIVAFLLLWGNLLLADRLSPRRVVRVMRPDGTVGPEDEVVERFQEWIEPREGRVRLILSAAFGVIIGLGAAAWWQNFLLWRNGTDFGMTDPIFEHDLSLYVFGLPFYRDVFGWAFQLIVVAALITAALHYLNGGVQFSGVESRVDSGVKVHLSVLLAIIAGLKAIGYQLDKWDLLYSPRGQVTGASFTDVEAQIPALNLLILISLVAVVILLVNIRFRGWRLPFIAAGLWLFTSVVVGGVYPAVIQRFRVEPDEINKEIEYVDYNIQFTRLGFGLDAVVENDFAAIPELDAADIAANRPTIDNLRLWDPTVLNRTYQQLQELRTYYQIEDVDVDRYLIDGELTQVMVSARELDEDSLPDTGWVNEHLVFTHGFGAVLSPANTVTPDGSPDFLVQDIPPIAKDPAVEISQERLYFGDESTGRFLIVGTKEKELDFPTGSGEDTVEFTSYEGAGGVDLGGIFRRLAWALRFGDVNTLISGQLTADSKVLMVRNVRERVEKAAPFLISDADPYLVVTEDGRLVWIVDLYSVTDKLPYSEPADTRRLRFPEAGLPGDFNYIRNSVKVVVDAYDGTMDFYVIDDEDPLTSTYRKVFPDVFQDGSEMPDDIRAHLRYPEDMFRVQSDMYQAYHETDPRVFFNNGDLWQIARDPSTPLERERLRGDGSFFEEGNTQFIPMLPYYLLMELPEEDDLSFLIMQPFVPRNRPNMVGFLVAKSDPGSYGEIVEYSLPRDRQVDGPGQVGNLINQDPDISREFTLLGQQGSRVIQGNMLVVPVEESVLYVQPIYITAEQGGLPEFKRVVVFFEEQIAMRDTLDDALAAVFGGEAPTPDPGPGPGPIDGELPEVVASLLTQADTAFEAADQALRDGDLVTYAERVAEARALIAEAVTLLGEE